MPWPKSNAYINKGGDVRLTFVLGLLLVDEVETLGLELLVNEGTSEAGTG